MKNPNGYGTVVKLGGKRRRPFMARKTAGYKENGQPIQVPVGYFATRAEALACLAQNYLQPLDLTSANITFKELFDRWYQKARIAYRDQSKQALTKMAYQHSGILYFRRYRDLKAEDFQKAIDASGLSASSKKKMLTLYHEMDDYALEAGIVPKAQSQFVVLAETVQAPERHVFTRAEIDALWTHSGDSIAQIALILLYSGWRIGELMNMPTSAVDLEAGTMRGGSKTAAGKNRIVPIHHRILPLIEARMDGEMLIEYRTNSGIRRRWDAALEEYGISPHIPHETRHTFISLLDSLDANPRCISLLVGHSSGSVTQKVYTHKSLDELRETVELLP